MQPTLWCKLNYLYGIENSFSPYHLYEVQLDLFIGFLCWNFSWFWLALLNYQMHLLSDVRICIT